MWPFTEAVRAESIPPQTDETRLAEIEKEFRVADSDFRTACTALMRYAAQHADARVHVLNGKLFARVGAMSADPVLQQLEAAREQARERRSFRLRERADLLTTLRKIG
ncbi:MAG: hypothetical protein JWN63_2578 [Candidatus Acidoferrum typicum]|nr:hypothetical protein [Candidatus Acidoferrum typicum]